MTKDKLQQLMNSCWNKQWILNHKIAKLEDKIDTILFKDFKSISKNGTICLLEFGDSEVASYNFEYYNSDKSEYERISKFTEKKAYLLNIIIFAIFLWSFSIILKNENNNRS